MTGPAPFAIEQELAGIEVYPGVQHGFWRRTDNDQAGPALGRVATFLSTL